jgi:hypothetical protein
MDNMLYIAVVSDVRICFRFPIQLKTPMRLVCKAFLHEFLTSSSLKHIQEQLLASLIAHSTLSWQFFFVFLRSSCCIDMFSDSFLTLAKLTIIHQESFYTTYIVDR